MQELSSPMKLSFPKWPAQEYAAYVTDPECFTGLLKVVQKGGHKSTMPAMQGCSSLACPMQPPCRQT